VPPNLPLPTPLIDLFPSSAPFPLDPVSLSAHPQFTICGVGSPQVSLSPAPLALRLEDPSNPPPASEAQTPPPSCDPAAPPWLPGPSSPPEPICPPAPLGSLIPSTAPCPFVPLAPLGSSFPPVPPQSSVAMAPTTTLRISAYTLAAKVSSPSLPRAPPPPALPL
ncbi:hypothetical protein M9458_011364, partial [Cirrhinus mrigala]